MRAASPGYGKELQPTNLENREEHSSNDLQSCRTEHGKIAC
jgi:hypothetical protein